MTDDRRSIEMEVEVPGTPEEVWQAIATGPGVTSWYVPHTIEEREGGASVANFGPGMEAAGRVAVWDPPHRLVIDGGEADEGLAFEWLVEGRDGGTCVVRLVNSGFSSGAEWDAQYNAMREGWKLFLLNLQLHLEHFAGRVASVALPMGMWPGGVDDAWAALTDTLGVPPTPAVGDRVTVGNAEAPSLSGTVVAVDSWRMSLLVDAPAEGTAFLAAEDYGEAVGVSIWSYLYGDEGAAAVERDEPRWREWLEANTPTPEQIS